MIEFLRSFRKEKPVLTTKETFDPLAQQLITAFSYYKEADSGVIWAEWSLDLIRRGENDIDLRDFMGRVEELERRGFLEMAEEIPHLECQRPFHRDKITQRGIKAAKALKKAEITFEEQVTISVPV